MRLALIYSGGTIGCDGTPLAPLPAAAFQRLWARHVGPELRDVTAVDWQWLEPPLDSSAMVPADWARLAGLVLGADEEEAVLLLHGTDTMAWSAAALAYLLTLYDATGRPVGRFGLPVVLTGAQRPLFQGEAIRAGTDALANLRNAAAACRDSSPSVTIAFGGHRLPGTRVTKVSTTADAAFASPSGAGEAPGPILPAARPTELKTQLGRIAPHLGRRIALDLTVSPNDPDMLADHLEALLQAFGSRLGGLWLGGFGIGNFPRSLRIEALIARAAASGAIVVAASQVPFGAVDPTTYGAGHWLAGCGAIPAADMARPAGQAKLHLALALAAAHGWDRAATERFFLAPVAGERSVAQPARA